MNKLLDKLFVTAVCLIVIGVVLMAATDCAGNSIKTDPEPKYKEPVVRCVFDTDKDNWALIVNGVLSYTHNRFDSEDECFAYYAAAEATKEAIHEEEYPDP